MVKKLNVYCENNGAKMNKPRVEIYLDEERNDTNIEFYINPEKTFSISIDPSGNIDWAYLWGEHKDCGHGELFKKT
jgi:hypothetical protein